MAETDNTESSDASQADLSGLSQSSRDLLAVFAEVAVDYRPRPGTLHDLPQVTIEPGDTAEVCRLAKEDPCLAAKQLLCLACVDYEEYFQLVYSLDPDRTLAIKTNVPYDNPRLPSVTSIWRAADWYEREAHDLFGVIFEGHPNLSPLLLYDGFEGYPGRKEFPFNDYQEF